MPRLKLVMAGAGAGKTEYIRKRIAQHVAEGHDPARVVATTYTRSAAAELKTRIQAAILQHPELTPEVRVQKAERLELAPIGTVHSVGFQLATRYAIPLGLSPRLEVIEEDGQDRSLQELVACMDVGQWHQLIAVGRRLSINGVQKLVLELLEAKRGNRISDAAFQEQMTASGVRLCEVLAPNGTAKSAIGLDGLTKSAGDALTAIQRFVDTTRKTQDAVGRLRILANGGAGSWQDFLTAAKLEAGTRSGADGCLAALRAAGAAVRAEPGLHDDIREFLARLTQMTLALDEAYRKYKAERGLVDFTDLELLFLQLLESSELQAYLREEFDLIAVDEFQDTNPLQLAIFERLRTLADESHWVGDPKQAIFGFRGTDPGLVQSIWKSVPSDSQDTIPDNHRSQQGLVELFGRLFSPLLGDSATQRPNKPPIVHGIERWLLQTTNKNQDYLSLAVGVAQLRRESIRLRDIAILTRQNDDAMKIGDALKELGIPALLELPGLLSTREGALVLAGLRLVADRGDSLAAATVMHISENPKAETPAWLEERLGELIQAEATTGSSEAEGSKRTKRFVPWSENPRLTALTRIDPRVIPPSLVVQFVIDALEIDGFIRRWGDAARRSTNLDALVNLARNYEDNALEIGSAATLTGLITEFERLADDGGDKRLPPLGIEAVTILTYHKAKGREWPVVVLTGLDFERDADLWSPEVTGGSLREDDPLQDRTLRFWPWPFGRGLSNKLTAGSQLEVDALNTVEGQDAQQRSDAERLRLLYVGFTRAKEKLVLAHRTGRYPWLQTLPNIDTILNPELPPGEHALAGISTKLVVRHLDVGMVATHSQPAPAEQSWLKQVVTPAAEAIAVARYHSPSQTPAIGDAPTVQLEDLRGQPIFPRGYSEGQEGPLGDAVHGYFASLPSLAGMNADRKQSVALRCLTGHGVEGLLSADALVETGDRFIDWVNQKYPNATWHTEVPVVAPRSAGGQWVGNIDLMLRLADGSVIIIDHKSAPLKKASCTAKAQSFSGQVQAYRDCIKSLGLPVAQVWIHFPLAAVMAELSE